MPHRSYTYPIPDDPKEIERQLGILLRRRNNLERTARLSGYIEIGPVGGFIVLIALVIALILTISTNSNTVRYPGFALIFMLCAALLNWRKLIKLFGFPVDSNASDFLFSHRAYLRSDTTIVNEQIVAFASKLKAIRDAERDR